MVMKIKSKDYIDISNLSRIRSALAVLGNAVITPDSVLTQKDYNSIIKILDSQEGKHFEIINTTE